MRALRQRRIHFRIESGPVQDDDCKESVEEKRDDEEVGEECCIACLSPSGNPPYEGEHDAERNSAEKNEGDPTSPARARVI